MRGKTNLPQDIVTEPGGGEIGEFIPKWTERVIGTAGKLLKVIHDGTYFVTCSSIGDICYSIDGNSWSVKRVFDGTITDFIYINQMYVLVGNTDVKGIIAISTDLITWEIKETEFENIIGIGWVNNSFIIPVKKSGTNLEIYSSSDFTEFKLNFTESNSIFIGDRSYSLKCFSENSRFMLVCIHDQGSSFDNPVSIETVISTDGIKFIRTTSNTNRYVSGRISNEVNVYYANGYYLFNVVNAPMQTVSPNTYAGDSFFYKTLNGIEWQEIAVKRTYETSDIAAKMVWKNHVMLYVNDKYLLIGEAKYLTCDDLDNLVDMDLTLKFPNSTIANGIVAYDKKIVVIGNDGVVITADTISNTYSKLTITPSIKQQSLFIRRKDNVRELDIRPVTSNIDTNIMPENIKSGVTILGVEGSFTG